MAADFFSRGNNSSEVEEGGFRITREQAWTFLGRYKWVIAAVFACTVLGAYTAISLTTELYEVQSSLLVKLGRENLDAPPTARNAVLSTGLRREELGSEAAMLRSPDLLAQVVDEIGVDAFKVTRVPPPGLFGKAKFYTKAGLRWVKGQYQEVLIAVDLKKRLTDREAAIGLLVDKMVAEPQKDADVVGLTLHLADPELAKRIQATLIEKYLTHRVQVRQNGGVREFFEREAAELHSTLLEAETRVNQWKRQQGLTVPDEQKALLLREIRELSAARERARSRGQALTTQLAAARSLMAAMPERVQASQVESAAASVQQLRERLMKLETERARMLTTYKEGAEPVQTLTGEITALRDLLATQSRSEVGSVTTQLNPLRQQLQQSINGDAVTVEGLAAELEEQGRQTARLEADLRRLETSDAALVALERDRLIAEQNYLNAVKRLSEAEVTSALDVSRISNVAVAMPPTASLQPVYPRKLLLMLVALPVGLMLGLGLAMAMEWASDTVHDAEDVEAATELVCLGSFGQKKPFSGAA